MQTWLISINYDWWKSWFKPINMIFGIQVYYDCINILFKIIFCKYLCKHDWYQVWLMSIMLNSFIIIQSINIKCGFWVYYDHLNIMLFFLHKCLCKHDWCQSLQVSHFYKNIWNLECKHIRLCKYIIAKMLCKHWCKKHDWNMSNLHNILHIFFSNMFGHW